jgi:hypothetical protein
MIDLKLFYVLSVVLVSACQAFTHKYMIKTSRTTITSTTCSSFTSTLLLANRKMNASRGGSSSKGFGNNNSNSNNMKRLEKVVYEKTYDQTSFLTSEVIEGKMNDFFSKNTDWHPLFAYVATDSNVPAAKHVEMIASSNKIPLEYTDGAPWVDLPSMPMGPDKEKHMQTIAHVLDKTQMAMLDIPSEEDDHSDLNFVEEGRRILVLNRFHVVEQDGEGKQDGGDFDTLFRTCWSEIHSLVSNNEPKTGSLIIVDDMEKEVDLNNFVHQNIRLPLEWLGIGDDHIEVAYFTRGMKCIRLIHRLGDIPDLKERDRALKEDQQQKDNGSDDFQNSFF